MYFTACMQLKQRIELLFCVSKRSTSSARLILLHITILFKRVQFNRSEGPKLCSPEKENLESKYICIIEVGNSWSIYVIGTRTYLMSSVLTEQHYCCFWGLLLPRRGPRTLLGILFSDFWEVWSPNRCLNSTLMFCYKRIGLNLLSVEE